MRRPIIGVIALVGLTPVWACKDEGPALPPGLYGLYHGAFDSIGVELSLQSGESNLTVTGSGTLIVGLASYAVTVAGNIDSDGSYSWPLTAGPFTAHLAGTLDGPYVLLDGFAGTLSGFGGTSAVQMYFLNDSHWNAGGFAGFAQTALTMSSMGTVTVHESGMTGLFTCANCLISNGPGPNFSAAWLGVERPVTFHIRNPALLQMVSGVAGVGFPPCESSSGRTPRCSYALHSLGPTGQTWVVATVPGLVSPTDSILVTVQ